MAVFVTRTRAQTRQSIGMALGVLDQSNGSVTLQVTGTSSADGWAVGSLSFGDSNEHRGKWVVAVAGSSNASSNVGLIRRVSGSSAGHLAFVTNWAAIADTTTEFELWDEHASPILINDFINRAIQDATRKGSVPKETFGIHTGGGLQAFVLPSGSSFIGVEEVEFRSEWEGVSLTSFDSIMSSGSNTTVETDSANKREGQASAKVNLAAAVSSAATVATSSFSAIDARPYTHLEFWAMANITTTSSALRARLGEGSTARETLSIPAMATRTWTYHRVALGNPELDSAISQFVLMTGASDAGSMTVWLDDARLVRDTTERWTRLNPKFWSLDAVTRSVVFEDDITVPYALLKITGRRAPNLPTADTALLDVDPNYVVSHALAGLLRSKSAFVVGTPDAAMQQAEAFEKDAMARMIRMNGPQSVRWLGNS